MELYLQCRICVFNLQESLLHLTIIKKNGPEGSLADYVSHVMKAVKVNCEKDK